MRQLVKEMEERKKRDSERQRTTRKRNETAFEVEEREVICRTYVNEQSTRAL